MREGEREINIEAYKKSHKLKMSLVVLFLAAAVFFYLKIYSLTKTGQPVDDSFKYTVRTDSESIGRGKNLFDAKCDFCHNAYSTETNVGPGLKEILKSPKLPVSGYPAEPEYIRKQLKQPFSKMPSFDYLTEDEVENIIAFLNTL